MKTTTAPSSSSTQAVDNMGENGMHLRSLLDFSYPSDGGIPLEEVEPVSSILKRFKGGGHELRRPEQRGP